MTNVVSHLHATHLADTIPIALDSPPDGGRGVFRLFRVYLTWSYLYQDWYLLAEYRRSVKRKPRCTPYV